MNFKLAPDKMRQEIESECQQFIAFCLDLNPDLKNPALDTTLPFVLYEAKSTDELLSFFACDNWPTHASVIFDHLVFINQEEGKDRWWTFKKINGEWLPCDVFPVKKFLSADASLFIALIEKLKAASIEDLAKMNSAHLPQPEIIIAISQTESRLFETAGIHAAAEENPALRQFIIQSLTRFMKRDWGDIDKEDWASNDAQEDYHLGSYNFPDTVNMPDQHRIWIIFDGTATTILFPDEY